MKTEDKPRFLLAAEELAKQRGTDAREILRQDREAASNSGYPGPDCLAPDEIETFFADPDALEADRAEHARNCVGCSALLASAEVDPPEIERLLAEVRAWSRESPRPLLIRGGPAGRPEAAESSPGRKVVWAAATFGSVLAAGSVLAVGSILRRIRRSISPKPAAESEEALAPIAVEK